VRVKPAQPRSWLSIRALHPDKTRLIRFGRHAAKQRHPSLRWFCNQVRWLWLKSLRRRSQNARLSWARFLKFVDRFFPPIKVLHPLPCHRFDATTRGRSPVR
jgi:hypothetical protein